MNHHHLQPSSRTSLNDDDLLDDSAFFQFSQSISSVHCIIEEGDEDQEEEEEGGADRQLLDDEHSEIDSDSEENHDAIHHEQQQQRDSIIEDNEINFSDNEETENNEILDSDNENNDQDEEEIDSDDEIMEEPIRFQKPFYHRPDHIVQEHDSEDSSDDFGPDKLFDNDESSSPSPQTAPTYLSNSEYSAFYNSDDGTRSNSHSTAFHDSDNNTRSHSMSSTVFSQETLFSQEELFEDMKPNSTGENFSEGPTIQPMKGGSDNKGFRPDMKPTIEPLKSEGPTIQPLKGGNFSPPAEFEDPLKPTIEPLKTGDILSEGPIIQPLKGGSDYSSFRADKSPPRRQRRHPGPSGTRSERGARTFGVIQHDDMSKSERGLRTFHDTTSSSTATTTITTTTTTITPTHAKLRGLSPPRNSQQGDATTTLNFQAEMSPPRHHLKRHDMKTGVLQETDLSGSERGLRSIGVPSLHEDDDIEEDVDHVIITTTNVNNNNKGSKRSLMGPPPIVPVQQQQQRQNDFNHRSERGMRTIGSDMSRSERGLRTIGADMSRSERGVRTFGSGVVDTNRSQRGLRTIGADLSRSERGMRTFGGGGGAEKMIRSERGARSIGGVGVGGGPRRGPRRRHLVATGNPMRSSYTKAASNSVSSPSSTSFKRAESPQHSSEFLKVEEEEQENNRQHQGETDEGAESNNENKDKSNLNLLVSIQPQNENNNDVPFQDDDDVDDSLQDDAPLEQLGGPNSSTNSPTRATNYIEILQSKIPNDSKVPSSLHHQHQNGACKSVAARLFAERNKIYSPGASSHPSKEMDASTGFPPLPSSLFLEPSTSRQPLQKQKSLPEEEALENVGPNFPTTTREDASATSGYIEELLQDYHILADRLKSLVASVRIYHQSNQELKNARGKLLEDCDVLCRDAAREMGRQFKRDDPSIACRSADAKYEIDRTWRSRARIRHYFSSIKQQQTITSNDAGEEDVPDKESKEWSSSTQTGMREEDLVLQQQQEVLDYVVEWEDIVGTDVEQQIQILKKLQDEKDHYDRKVKKLQGRMKLLNPLKRPSATDTEHGGWGQSKLDRNLSKQSTSSQNYDAKESEVAFLLKQVTHFGWKDLYPLIEATMFQEWRRLNDEQHGSFGVYMSIAIEEIERVQAEETKKEQDRLSGISSNTLICPMAVVEGEPGNFNVSKVRYISEEALDPSKPLLVIDNRSPHGVVAWMAMLEHEQDPFHPALFDLQLMDCDSSDASSPDREKKRFVDAFRLRERYRLEETTPLLIHKGSVFFGTLCLAEYMNRFWKGQLPTVALHEPASVIPPNPLEEYNMNGFLQQHSIMETLWNDILKFWLEWHRDENSATKMTIDAKVQVKQFIMTVEEVDLAKFPGPYLCGHRFTLADIHLFAYWEHILLLLTMLKMLDQEDDSGIYHDWVFGGSQLPRFSAWYDNVSSRSSARAMAVGADSTSMSKEGEPTAEERQQIMKSRRNYLIEHYNSLQ